MSNTEVCTGEHNIEDQYRFSVSEQQFDAFQALLDRPSQHKDGLEHLFLRVAPWEADKEASVQARAD